VSEGAAVCVFVEAV